MLTSHDVVQRVRRSLGIRAAGHTGTLDPFATGLLVVLVGRATRLARFVEGQPKTYLAAARLGIRTDTDDLTGRILETSATAGSIDAGLIRQVLAGLVGTRLQRPPDYSAKHVGGERSYQKARRGESVQLAEVSVTVHWIEVVECLPPMVTFRAAVGSGTYLRALARDLGDQLGVGAHLTSLRREAIGALRVEDATSLDNLGPSALVPARDVLPHLPHVELDEAARTAVMHGRAVEDSGEAGKRGSGTFVGLLMNGELVAVAKAEDGWLHPTVVLGTP